MKCTISMFDIMKKFLNFWPQANNHNYCLFRLMHIWENSILVTEPLNGKFFCKNWPAAIAAKPFNVYFQLFFMNL